MAAARRWLPWIVLGVLIATVLFVAVRPASSSDGSPEARVERLTEELRCPTCQGLSVADSPSSTARAMTADVRRRVEVGETDAEIRQVYVETWGEWILLSPEGSGLGAVVWALPVSGVVLSAAGLGFVLRRWRREPALEATVEDRALVADARAQPDGEDELLEERDFLLRSLDDLERERADDDIDDETYTRLRDDYTARAAAVLRAIRDGSSSDVVDDSDGGRRTRTTRLVIVGAGVVVFAVVAGILLARAVGERAPGGSATGNQQLADGEEASSAAEQLTALEAAVEAAPDDPTAHLELARFLAPDDPARALEEYDEVVALDPANAEARAYGGWIVHLAGLPDEAMTRIDRAVATDPEYPDAHFFRGMTLFQGVGDAEAAVVEFDRYLELAPDGAFAEQVREIRDQAAEQTSTQGSNP